MNDLINLLKTLFETHGFKVAVIVLITILLVNLLKKPIVKKAEKYAEKHNCDKSVITRYITVLPYIVSFIIAYLWELILLNFEFAQIDYGTLLTNVLMYGSLSISTFETLKLQFEAYASKKLIKDTNAIKIESTIICEQKEEHVNTNTEIL